MLDFQIKSMQNTVKRLLAYKRPPLTVMIQIDHAKFIGVKYIEDTSDVFKMREKEGKPTPKLVVVQLGDLALALLGVKSVEDRIRGTGD